MVACPKWSEAERRAWALPEKLTVSEWARRYRRLSTKDSNEPGQYRPERTPYLIEPMNACVDPTIEEIVFKKPAQIGGSEFARNVIGYWVDQDPAPILLVLPDEKAGKKIFAKRVVTMFLNNPRLARHMTGRKRDVTDYHIEFRNAIISMAWAGSAQSLASDQDRYVVFEETDKYPPFSGKDVDPISLGKERATTFEGNRKFLYLSTPTTRHGNIWMLWEGCTIQKHYHVPCPHCGEYQALDFTRLTWPGKLEGEDSLQQADRIEHNQATTYKCAHCDGEITQRHKTLMVARGVWIDPKHQKVDAAGQITGSLPASRRVGYTINALYSPWVNWHDLAAEFLRVKDTPHLLMAFRNNKLAEAHEERTSVVNTGAIDAKISAGHKPRVVPVWAGTLISTVDTQKAHFKFVIRAWGRGGQSRLIHHGRVETFEDLTRVCLQSRFPFEDEGMPHIAPRMLFIDAGGGAYGQTEEGTRTHQVYKYAESAPHQIVPLHGHGGSKAMALFFQMRTIKYRPPDSQKEMAVTYLRVNTDHYKDVLAGRIRAEADAPAAWEIHKDVGADYKMEMTTEHKVMMGRGAARAFKWVKTSSGAVNDYWDAEVYQICAADVLHLENTPSVKAMIESRKAQQQHAQQYTGRTTPDGRPFSVLDR